jgi:hypothetical protein
MAPKSAEAVADAFVERLDRRIVLKFLRKSRRMRLCLHIMNGTHRESQVWLSDTPSERLNEILATTDVTEEDMPAEFKATLLSGENPHPCASVPPYFCPTAHPSARLRHDQLTALCLLCAPDT